jgi:hypothetical protein
MRKFVVLIGLVVGLAALAMVANDASAKTILVSLTQQQVANVCGKNTQTGGGHTGCTKSCGGGTQVCDFDCNNKSGKCTGSCVTCAQRKFPFGENFPAHVVKKDVRVAR